MKRRILRLWIAAVMAVSLAATGVLADGAMEHHGVVPIPVAETHGSCDDHGDHAGHGAESSCFAMVGSCISAVERVPCWTPGGLPSVVQRLAAGLFDGPRGVMPDEELPPPRV